MSVLAVAVGMPIALFTGTYLAEYGKHTRFAFVVRFVNDILLSAPSIVIGIFIWRNPGGTDAPFLGLGGRRRAGP